MKTKNRP